jgi:nucleoside-diphosphate-sugar epimerase
MKVLIIGGTGLISTAITRYLIERGDEVTLYNRGTTEARIPVGSTLIRGDRKAYAAFEAQMAGAGSFDCVIDMICFLPEEAESAIRAFKGRVGHFIICSTVDVYSKPANRYPIVEAEPYKPASLYGLNKVRAEQIFLAAHERGDFPVTIIRPAYTYGEGGRLVYTFGWNTYQVDRMRKGKPLVVHGDGSSLWVACHIDDAGRAFAEAAGKSQTFGRAYHVTGEAWLTWNRYYQEMAEALDAPEPVLIHIPSNLLARLTPKGQICVENFQFNNIFDNSAARTDLNFRYTIPWKEGVRRAVAWLDERDRIPNSDDDPHDDRVIATWQRHSANLVQEMSDLKS